MVGRQQKTYPAVPRVALAKGGDGNERGENEADRSTSIVLPLCFNYCMYVGVCESSKAGEKLKPSRRGLRANGKRQAGM